jgi:hypothetical protein
VKILLVATANKRLCKIAGLAPKTIKILKMDKQNILDAVNEWLTPSFDTETQEAVKL